MEPVSLFANTRFQVFMFVGGISMLLADLAGDKNGALTIYAITSISVLAILVFVVHLILEFFKGKRSTSSSADLRAQPPSAWPDDNQIRVARGFMILGLLIYLGYHFLDRFVIVGENAALRVEQILGIRLTVSGIIVLFWLLSFHSVFKSKYVSIVTVAITIAGIGIGAMLYIAGREVHFYYEGFIQVIAFAAFAFRLPPRPLAFICGLMMCLYAGVSLFQSWDGRGFSLTALSIDREQQAIIANNLVSLVTFVTLSLIASSALQARVPR
jgi:hypothetical protein